MVQSVSAVKRGFHRPGRGGGTPVSSAQDIKSHLLGWPAGSIVVLQQAIFMKAKPFVQADSCKIVRVNMQACTLYIPLLSGMPQCCLQVQYTSHNFFSCKFQATRTFHVPVQVFDSKQQGQARLRSSSTVFEDC